MNQTLKNISMIGATVGAVYAYNALFKYVGSTERDAQWRSQLRSDLETATGIVCPNPDQPEESGILFKQNKDKENSLYMKCADGRQVYVPLGEPIIK